MRILEESFTQGDSQMTRPIIEQKIVINAIKLGMKILRQRQQASKPKRKTTKGSKRS
jgi:hypothetical protein